MFKIFCNTLQSKTFKSALFLMGCLLCTEALATIFTVAPTDRSKIYLGMVLGGSVGGIQLSGDINNTLSLMFARFNYIILTVGVLVISYIGVSSTINTAREGEALGKKMSLWVPMRAMLGTLLMVPSPASGYSVVQMTVLWIVLNGIGAANSVWSVILNQLQQGVGIVANASATITNVNFPQNLDPLIESAMLSSTCMYALNNMPELNNVPGNFQSYGPIKPFVRKSTVTPTISHADDTPSTLDQTATFNIGLEGAPSPYDQICGTFQVKTNLSSDDTKNTFNIATVQQRTAVKIAALQAVFNAVDPAARVITQSSMTTTGIINEKFYTPPVRGYYLAAKQAYTSTIAQLYQGVQLDPQENAQSFELGLKSLTPHSGSARRTANEIAAVQSYGWIHAGSYYYSLIKNSLQPPSGDSTALPDITLVPTTAELNPENMPTVTTWPAYGGTGNNEALTGTTGLLTGTAPTYQTKKLKSYLDHMIQYYSIDQKYTTLSGQARLMGRNSGTGSKFLDLIINKTTRPLQDTVMNHFQNLTAGAGQDPLASLHQFGWSLMITAEVMTFIAIIASFGVSLAGASGSCMNPLPWALDILLSQIWPLILALCAMLWTGGATLNIYLPMVPYLIFTTAAFSWILAVIEAVVGAPIVALALAHPSGEELGKVGQPLILLANVFLRPMLMLFGFVLGAGLLRAGIALINFGFLPAINLATTPTLFSIIAVLMMYIMLIMAIVNKSFSLIYLLPNQIMRWLGGPTETSDPSDMVKEAKGGFDTGAKTGQAGVNEGVNQAKSSMSDAKGKGKEERAEQKADARSAAQIAASKGEGGGGAMPTPAPSSSAPSSSGTGGLGDPPQK